MIIYCQQCNTNPVEGINPGSFLHGRFHSEMHRPLCIACNCTEPDTPIYLRTVVVCPSCWHEVDPDKPHEPGSRECLRVLFRGVEGAFS